MIAWAIVAGGVGAVVRWWLSELNGRWPTGTLVANILGSFALGLVIGSDPGNPVLVAVVVGFLGGLTTFSTFAVELVERPQPLAWQYGLASVVGGLVAAGAGLWLGFGLLAG